MVTGSYKDTVLQGGRVAMVTGSDIGHRHNVTKPGELLWAAGSYICSLDRTSQKEDEFFKLLLQAYLQK